MLGRLKNLAGAVKMAELVKGLAAKPDGVNQIPETRMVLRPVW